MCVSVGRRACRCGPKYAEASCSSGVVSSFFRSLTDNTFASQLVRIQAERSQRVIETGVYGFVRHPMYLGAT